jgi:nicotinamide-nucleotide amidase
VTEVAAIHERLWAVGATVAVAESLTGGRLCAALTATPGASATMRGGLVVYATDLKASLAGVDAALLTERGAVDPQVAAALAAGARTRLAATFGVGVTGVAGPEPQDGCEVGTVFAAVAGPTGVTSRSWNFAGDRAAVQAAAVSGCLQLLAEAVGPRAAEATES